MYGWRGEKSVFIRYRIFSKRDISIKIGFLHCRRFSDESQKSAIN